MTLETLYYVSQIIAVLAILGSLIFVGLQVRDNTKSLQTTSLQSILDGVRDRYLLPMAHDEEVSEILSRGMTSIDLLSDAEIRRFCHMISEFVFQLQHAMQLYEKGLIEEVDFTAWLKVTASFIRTSGGMVIWEQTQRLTTPTIVKTINDELAAFPDDPSFIEVMPLFEYKTSTTG